jgi:hypothetical protein
MVSLGVSRDCQRLFDFAINLSRTAGSLVSKSVLRELISLIRAGTASMSVALRAMETSGSSELVVLLVAEVEPDPEEFNDETEFSSVLSVEL